MAEKNTKTTTKRKRLKRKTPPLEELDEEYQKDHGNEKVLKPAQKASKYLSGSIKRQGNTSEHNHVSWNIGEIYNPMRKYMNSIKLPPDTPKMGRILKEKVNVVESDDILSHNVVILYFDCIHKLSRSAESVLVRKNFPESIKEESLTPFNDRRKLGHLSWCLQSSHLIVHLYVAFKWKRSQSISSLDYEALNLAVERLSHLLKDELVQRKRQANCLSVGTHFLHDVDEDKFISIFQEKFEFPISILKDSK